MKKLALILATAAAIGAAAPAFAQDVSVRIGTGVHHHRHHGAIVVHRRHYHPRAVIVVRRDRGLHRSWRHSHHYGAGAGVTIR